MTLARTALLVLCVLLCLLLVLLSSQFQGSEKSEAPGPMVPPAAEAPQMLDRPATQLDAAGISVSPDAPLVGQRSEVAADQVPSELDVALECVVHGRIVDEQDQPITEALVRLQAYKVWTEGVDVPRLEEGSELCGFEVRTGASGEFRIAAPVPTAGHTWLTIEADPYHDNYSVYFQTQRSNAQPSLVAGERDLGVVRLATTGAVRGRVTDASGQPLGEVHMGVGPGVSSTFGLQDVLSAPDGSYFIPHAPVGTYGVKTKVEGFLSQFQTPVTVEAQRETTGIDFVLEAAPTLEGIVVDENGSPLEGARLWGWPSTYGSGAGTQSGADGRFVVSLPQAEPYTLGAKLEGYLTWGDESDRSRAFQPGTRDIEVTMHSVPDARFLIVDDETGQPIEHFGLSILHDNGSRSPNRSYTERRPPRQAFHAGGILEATARAGLDLYVVAADGYLLATGDVEHETPELPAQTVRMRRGGSIIGRVLREGQVVAGVSVDVELGSMHVEPGAEPDDEESRRFYPRQNARRSATTGADGRFEVIAIEGGTYRISVRPTTGAPLVVVPFMAKARATNDAGDLSLVPGAALEGRVLLPPGVAAGGLEVWLDDRRAGVSTTTDDEGAFRLEDLAPGAHVLILDDRPGELAAGKPTPVELRSGETASVTLDARDRAMCQVTLVVDLGELSVEGRQVNLRSVSDTRERATLGKCDAQGRVTGHARAWGEARVIVYIPGWRNVEHPTVRLQLEAGATLTEDVTFEFASITLAMPPGVEPVSTGRAELTLRSPGTEQPAVTARLAFRDGQPDESVAQVAHVEAGGLWFGCLPAGAYQLTLKWIDESKEMEMIPLGGGQFSLEHPTVFEATQPVELQVGKNLRVVLN